jgi:hypothetical protein
MLLAARESAAFVVISAVELRRALEDGAIREACLSCACR